MYVYEGGCVNPIQKEEVYGDGTPRGGGGEVVPTVPKTMEE